MRLLSKGSIFIREFRDINVDHFIDLSKVSNCDVEHDEMLFGLDNFFLADPAEVKVNFVVKTIAHI